MSDKEPIQLPQIERRCVSGIEFRAAPEGNQDTIGTIGGYAAVFESMSEDMGYFYEILSRGAFDEALKADTDILGLMQHDPDQVLGRRSNEHLRLSVDDKGLKYEIDLPNTSAGRDALVSIRRGDINGSSFSFSLYPGGQSGWEKRGDKLIRKITKVARIFDVGPVTYAAYADTTAEARSLSAILAEGRKAVTPPPDFADRDRFIAGHKLRMELWT